MFLLNFQDLEEFKHELLKEINKNVSREEKRYLKSADVRKMLGGISAAKLQSLRVGGHIPAINADGLWLYDTDDIIGFINSNKVNRKEDCDGELRHQL